MYRRGNVLTPQKGLWLTNGSTYSKKIWMGINDKKENWSEVEESEVPDEFKEEPKESEE